MSLCSVSDCVCENDSSDQLSESSFLLPRLAARPLSGASNGVVDVGLVEAVFGLLAQKQYLKYMPVKRFFFLI